MIHYRKHYRLIIVRNFLSTGRAVLETRDFYNMDAAIASMECHAEQFENSWPENDVHCYMLDFGGTLYYEPKDGEHIREDLSIERI